MKSTALLTTLRSLPSRCLPLLLCLLLPLAGMAAGKEVDFSNQDKPLYDQVVEHIRQKVAARIGNAAHKEDRYFIVPFAYEDEANKPQSSHSFMTVIRVLGQGVPPSRESVFRTGKYKNWNFEAFTISWLPHDFAENPNLCVFEGFGARIIPSWNKCPLSVGKSFDLAATLKLAEGAHLAVGIWGPYEITKGGFDTAVQRLRLLQGGTIKYRADDRDYRKDRIAINCFHAMAGLEDLFPNGGLFGSGFKMWGLNGTRRVLIEYNERGYEKGLLLEKADPKKDLYGFVYAAEPGDRPSFNPFQTASVYRK